MDIKSFSIRSIVCSGLVFYQIVELLYQVIMAFNIPQSVYYQIQDVAGLDSYDMHRLGKRFGLLLVWLSSLPKLMMLMFQFNQVAAAARLTKRSGPNKPLKEAFNPYYGLSFRIAELMPIISSLLYFDKYTLKIDWSDFRVYMRSDFAKSSLRVATFEVVLLSTIEFVSLVSTWFS